MKGRAPTVSPFALGLLALGLFLMIFPAMRVAGIISLILGVSYWLLMAALKIRCP